MFIFSDMLDGIRFGISGFTYEKKISPSKAQP